jgi:transposase
VSYQAEYYKANKASIIKRIKKWQAENPEKLQASQAKYYQINKAKFKEQRKVQRTKFIFYKDFLKPFLSLSNLINSDLFSRMREAVEPGLELYILTSWHHEPFLTQIEIAKVLNVHQTYLSKIINTKLYETLAPVISSYKTKEPSLLDLIEKINHE